MAQYLTLDELAQQYPGYEILNSSPEVTVGEDEDADEAKETVQQWIDTVKSEEGEDIDTPMGIPSTLEPYRRVIVRIYTVVANTVKYYALKLAVLIYSRGTN